SPGGGSRSRESRCRVSPWRAGHLYARVGKRCLDALIGSVLLVLLMPVLVCIGLAIRLRLGSPVLFMQDRSGLNGCPFTLVKFRTMGQENADGPERLPDEQRLTALGRFLRSTSLDELPELWNVIRGEMSLVGPRPLLVHYISRYTLEQARRHEVRPGLTGWAQIHGRNRLSWEDKFSLDVWYVDHSSLVLDLKILTRTLCKLVTREGIAQPGHATAAEFLGRTPR